jgi:hypothetical protein
MGMATQTPIADALQALARLISEQLLARLGELLAEEQQIRTLLRAAHARERVQRVTHSPPGEDSRAR